ncbi:ATP-binding protein [Clostridiaceae bacterium 35-E11]
MEIAVLSGKGGTGKTTVATNLAKTMGWNYVDCDVEEPNGFIFLNPKITDTRKVAIPVPKMNQEKCTLCKKCIDICQFNALANVGNQIIFFDKLCHGCGACTLVCPTDAIVEEDRVIGQIDIGKDDHSSCIRGILNIGEPMAGPIISQLKSLIGKETTILDCSPGSSCNVVKAISGVNYAILVTEPTSFGLHDLKIAVELARKMNIPFGVIINRAEKEESLIDQYCKEENIKVLGRILFDRKAAVLYAKGKLLIEDEDYKKSFQEMGDKLEEVILCSLLS